MVCGVLVALACATMQQLEDAANNGQHRRSAIVQAVQADKVPIKQQLSRCSAQRDAQLEMCANKMSFLGDHSFTIPKDLNEMKPFCKNLKDSIPCIQNYLKDCVQASFTKQVVGGVLRRARHQSSLVCSTDSGKRDFMDRMNCLTSTESIAKFHTFMDTGVARFEHIATDQVSADEKLMGLCCSYAIFQRELDSTMAQACRAGDRSSRDFIRKIATASVGEFYTLICEGLRTVDDCRESEKTRKLMQRLEDITANVKAKRLRPTSKSLVPVLLPILSAATAAT